MGCRVQPSAILPTIPPFQPIRKDRLYTAAECAAALATYIAAQGLDPSQQDRSLFKGRKTRITLDAYLQGLSA